MARKTKNRTSDSGEVSINMTPMIDCTFLLIIFFILTTQIVDAGIESIVTAKPLEPTLEVPDPTAEQPANQVIVNVVSKEDPGKIIWTPQGPNGKLAYTDEISHYSVNGERIETSEVNSKLRKILEDRKEEAIEAGFDEFFIQIRADARLPYRNVSRVFEVARKAGYEKMRLTAAE